MKTNISKILFRIAETLEKAVPEALTEEDIKRLNEEALSLLKKVKESSDKKEKDPLKELSYEDRILLLAFVVYKRQNIATEPIEDPNVEDAAKILHNKVYIKSEDKKKDKEVQENLEKDLTKQLAKAGLDIRK
jgi:hypothetical protein